MKAAMMCLHKSEHCLASVLISISQSLERLGDLRQLAKCRIVGLCERHLQLEPMTSVQ